jgi:ferritin-like metal-binding protein YciE
MVIQNPRDLFYYNLCAMYDAEQKLVQILPQLAQESLSPQARDAFMQHEQETRQHVRNLEQCFQTLGTQPGKLENHAVAGLRQDHEAFLQQQPPQQALTLFDLSAGLQSEYLEMAAYHSLIDAATIMGLQQCIPLFQQNLKQEEEAARKLATIAHQFGQEQVQLVRPQPPMPGQPYERVPPAPGQPYQPAGEQVVGQPYAPATSQGASISQLQQGMEVVGSDRQSIGRVRNTRDNDFLVDRPGQRDIYVPFSAIQNVDTDSGQVVLHIPTNQVDGMNWPNPPLL